MNTCCGHKPRARVIDGDLIEQPHRCQDRDNEPDWVEFQAEQIAQARPIPEKRRPLRQKRKRNQRRNVSDIAATLAESSVRQGVSLEDAIDFARAIEGELAERI
jgi:hypothetical protein